MQFWFENGVGGYFGTQVWREGVFDKLGATVGKRYSRNDELGIPFACTIDFTSMEDSNAVQTLKRNIEKCMSTRLDGSVGSAPKCETKAHGKSH